MSSMPCVGPRSRISFRKAQRRMIVVRFQRADASSVRQQCQKLLRKLCSFGLTFEVRRSFSPASQQRTQHQPPHRYSAVEPSMKPSNWLAPATTEQS